MPFGLTNLCPSHVSELHEDTLREHLDLFCNVYLDDIPVYSNSEEENLGHVLSILNKLLYFGVFCQPEKWELQVNKTEFLGYLPRACP